MIPLIQADKIKLRQRRSQVTDLTAGEESSLSLSAKLGELFGAGYERDDIYGLVIPLLMQGKVRIDLEDRSERLEMEDPSQQLQRSEAIQLFEEYLIARQPAASPAQAA